MWTRRFEGRAGRLCGAVMLPLAMLAGVLGTTGETVDASAKDPALKECLTPGECVPGRTVTLWDLENLHTDRLVAQPGNPGLTP